MIDFDKVSVGSKQHIVDVLDIELQMYLKMIVIRPMRKYLLSSENNKKVISVYNLWHWNLCRLLWIGYHKNIDSNDCYFAQLPEDVIKHICSFF